MTKNCRWWRTTVKCINSRQGDKCFLGRSAIHRITGSPADLILFSCFSYRKLAILFLQHTSQNNELQYDINIKRTEY